MKAIKVLLGVFFVCFIFSSYSVAVLANGAETIEVETTSYLVSSEWLPVGDEDGHMIGLQKREGEAVFPNGETARYLNIFTLDFRRGKGGTAAGYSKFTFEDDSSILCSWKTDLLVSKGLFSKQGDGTLVKGTGRFEGVSGTATFSGKQLKPASEDPKMTAVTTYILMMSE
jgi:hypothetical protein